MGAGSAGNFGHTKGSVDLKSFLDTLSGLLAIASLIPVADTAIDIAALLVDLLRGDYVSAALDLAGVIPFVGEVADTARIAKVTDKTIDAVKTAKKVDKAVDTAKATKKISKGKKITNSITKVKRVGKATKLDAHHAFPDIIDNYAGRAKIFSIKGADGKKRKLYQINGSLNGKDGIFEWILDNDKGVTHRRFIPNGKITGKPNSR